MPPAALSGESDIRIEDVGDMLTDVLRLGPFDPDTEACRVMFFVIPGNPGTLAFYKDFVVKLHDMAAALFSKRHVEVCTVAAGHANHHFAEPTRDQHPNAHEWLDFEAQIAHKKIFLNQEIMKQKYLKIYLVGHSIGAYFCPVLYEQCHLKERVESELLLLLPYIRHSQLPHFHRKQLEWFQTCDPVSTWVVCVLLSLLALLLPVIVKKYLVQQYAVLPPDICPTATATQLFTPRMVFNHFYMGVDEIKVVSKNEDAVIDILKHAHCRGQFAQKLVRPKEAQARAVSSRRANTAARTVVVAGLRYSLPEDLTTVTHIKDQFTSTSACAAVTEESLPFSLSSTLAHMWRLYQGQQPLNEAEEYWRGEISAGRVLLSHRRHQKTDPLPLWKQVSPCTLVQPGDKVKILTHRHERVIPAFRPALIATSPPLTPGGSDSQYFVFDKPAGVSCCEDPDTVNTLRALASEVVGQRLHLAHRLDQCVTGCVIMASSAKAASHARRLMQTGKEKERAAEKTEGGTERRTGKYYIARVRGNLPSALSTNTTANTPWRGLLQTAQTQTQHPSGQEKSRNSCSTRNENVLEIDSNALWTELDNRPEIKIESSLYYDSIANRSRVVSSAGGVGHKVGTPSTTVVTHLATLRDGSHLVRCQPITGHRHQIRCHLASIGLPIVNDWLYNASVQSESRNAPVPTSASSPTSSSTSQEDNVKEDLHVQQQGRSRQQAFVDDEYNTLETHLGQSSANFREWCSKCQWTRQQLAQTRAPVYVDSEEIWLRSWRYHLHALGVAATAALPSWALVAMEEKYDEQLATAVQNDTHIGTDTHIDSHPLGAVEVDAAAPLYSESLFDAARKREGLSFNEGAAAASSHCVKLQQQQPQEHQQNARQPLELPLGSSFPSKVFMLYTDQDVWAPLQDFHFFRKKLSTAFASHNNTATITPPHTTTLSANASTYTDADQYWDNNKRRVELREISSPQSSEPHAYNKKHCGKSDNSTNNGGSSPTAGAAGAGGSNSNIQYCPGLKHAFPLLEKQTDIVVQVLYQHLQLDLLLVDVHKQDNSNDNICNKITSR